MSHKPRHVPKIIKGGYTRIYTRVTQGFTQVFTQGVTFIYTTFEVLRLKIASEGKLVQMVVTKPSLTSTKELQNHQMGSINKWHPPKHQRGPLNHEFGSIIPT